MIKKGAEPVYIRENLLRQKYYIKREQKDPTDKNKEKHERITNRPTCAIKRNKGRE